MTVETTSLELEVRAYEALMGLKRPEESATDLVLRLTTAARASGFFGQGFSSETTAKESER